MSDRLPVSRVAELEPIGYEDVACDLCGSADRRELFSTHDFRYGIPGEFPLQRCGRCGLIYLSPRPDPATLPRYYPASYLPHDSDQASDVGRLGRAIRGFGFRGTGPLQSIVAWLYNSASYRAFLATAVPGRVLDVGCGAGGYLRTCQELGWTAEGLEPNREVATRTSQALRIPVHVGLLEHTDLPAAHYDLIAMVHSLEHMRSPRLALATARRALKPGGSLMVMVPNFAAWDRHLFRQRWYGMEVPRHFYHFTPHTLRVLLEAEGFRVDRLSGSAHPDTVVRNVRALLGRQDHSHRSTPVERVLATAVLLPLAVCRRSTALWAAARTPD